MQFKNTLWAAFALLLALGAAPAAHAQLSPGKLIEPSPKKVRKRYMFAQKDADCPVVANVTKNTDEDSDVTGSYTKVCYRTADEMLLEINELRKIHTWADSTYQRRLAAVPPGGAFVVTMRRQGPMNANPAWLWLTAKTKDGQEIIKDYNLKPGTGRFYGRDLYQIQQTVALPKVEATAWPITLILNDTHLRQLFEYTVTQPGK